jgi:membrane protease YdiL (CAAX protease family)
MHWQKIASGLFIGILIGWSFVVASLESRRPKVRSGPLARIAMMPGLPQIILVLVALLLAPPIEELLFRGVLYGGYRKSFGHVWAAALSAGIFVLLPITEVIHFPFAMIGLAGLALTALWCRLNWSAIGPAIGVHFGYNAVIVCGFLLEQHPGS